MLGNLGYAELSMGDLDSARSHLVESLDIARALNDHYGVVYETFNLGLAEYLSWLAGRGRSPVRGIVRPGQARPDEGRAPPTR